MSDSGAAAWKTTWKKLVKEIIAVERSIPVSNGYDDYQRESYDLVKQRDLATINTKKMLQGFQDSLARIRTNLKNIDNIKAKPDDNEYDITIVVEFPVFNTIVSLNSTLDTRTQSFIFAETSRNK